MTQTEMPDQIDEEDLPESVPDLLNEKISAALSIALPGHDATPDTTLVEAADIAGLKYSKLVEIAEEMGLDVQEMNESGLGIADSEDDLEEREPEAKQKRYCTNCEEEVWMDTWSSERGGWLIDSYRCQSCGGKGSRWNPGVTPLSYFGVVVSQEEERRLLAESD